MNSEQPKSGLSHKHGKIPPEWFDGEASEPKRSEAAQKQANELLEFGRSLFKKKPAPPSEDAPPRPLIRRPTADAEFKEADHPRSDDGKFGSGGGSAGEGSSSKHLASAADREAHVNRIVEKHGLSPVKVLAHDNEPDVLARAGRDSISINTDHWNPERLAQYRKEWDGLVVDSSPAGTITHELGHAAFAQINQHHFHRAEALAQKYYDASNGVEGGPPPPSAYAQENSHEWAAEAFCAMDAGHTDGLGPQEQQDKALAHAQEFWREMFKLRDEPPDPPPRRRR